MLYGIGLSLIAAYIFYIFQVIIPRNIRFKQTQHFICAKLYDVEISMNKIFSLLQGKAQCNNISKEEIASYLSGIDVFTKNSRYEIENHKELTVFEAITKYRNKVDRLADEILSGQCLQPKYEKIIYDLKVADFHKLIDEWNDDLPGEYEHCNAERNETGKYGYISVSDSAVKNQIISAIDKYQDIYHKIKKARNKIYRRII